MSLVKGARGGPGKGLLFEAEVIPPPSFSSTGCLLDHTHLPIAALFVPLWLSLGAFICGFSFNWHVKYQLHVTGHLVAGCRQPFRLCFLNIPSGRRCPEDPVVRTAEASEAAV